MTSVLADNCGRTDAPFLVEFHQLPIDYYDIRNRSVGIQCTMTLLEDTVIFDLKDSTERRKLLRRIYGLLIAQNLVSMLLIKVGAMCWDFNVQLPAVTITCFYFVVLAIYIIMYRFRHYRRHAPWQYIFYVFITLLIMTQQILSTGISGLQMAFDSLTVVTLELGVLCAYTMQTFLRLTVFRAIFIANAVTLALVALWTVLLVPATDEGSSPNISISYHGVLTAGYIIYETQLVFSGFHGYHLQANEYIFATTNIFVDYPRVLWFLIRSLILESTISTVRFLKKWCRAELC